MAGAPRTSTAGVEEAGRTVAQASPVPGVMAGAPRRQRRRRGGGSGVGASARGVMAGVRVRQRRASRRRVRSGLHFAGIARAASGGPAKRTVCVHFAGQGEDDGGNPAKCTPRDSPPRCPPLTFAGPPPPLAAGRAGTRPRCPLTFAGAGCCRGRPAAGIRLLDARLRRSPGPPLATRGRPAAGPQLAARESPCEPYATHASNAGRPAPSGSRSPQSYSGSALTVYCVNSPTPGVRSYRVSASASIAACSARWRSGP